MLKTLLGITWPDCVCRGNPWQLFVMGCDRLVLENMRWLSPKVGDFYGIFQFFADNDDLPTARIKGNTDFKSMGALGGCTRIGGALEIHSRF